MPTPLPSRSRSVRRSAAADQYSGFLACVALGLAGVLLTSLVLRPETGRISYSVYWLSDLAASEPGLEQLMFAF
jgi:hypothetical protein